MEYTADFEKFWYKYPRRWNKDLGIWVKRKKYPAFLKWQKLHPEIQQECLSKVKLVKKYEGSAVRDCVTWLNQRGWEDIEEDYIPVLSKENADAILKPVPPEPKQDTKTINQVVKEARS